jgi:hypothetical protein
MAKKRISYLRKKDNRKSDNLVHCEISYDKLSSLRQVQGNV